MRLFVALDLDDGAREALRHEQRRLAARLPDRVSLRWVRPDQTHLTLAFLGEIPEHAASRLVAAFDEPVAIPPFDVTFDHVGLFPPRGEPRVIWAGAGPGAADVARVYDECARRIRGLGLTVEDRPFHAHVTLGRFRSGRRGDAERAVDGGARRVIVTVRIDHVTLYQSRLSPAGPAYAALARANLT
jgi:2'-5' RNA ligase